MQRQPIICLSTQDFDDLWTRKQRFMRRFATQGHQVLYVQSQYHWLTYLKQLRSQWRRIFAFLLPPRRVEPNLYVATPPLLLPFFQMFTPLAAVNNLIIGVWLRWNARRLHLHDPLVYTYVIYSHLAIKILGSRKVLYEKVDDLSAARGLVRRVAVDRLEQRLLKAAGLVIVTAEKLKAMLQGQHENVHVIPNACELKHFNRTSEIQEPHHLVASVPTPRIGFVGAIAYWLDLDLIARIARARSEWQIVLIGPVRVNVSRLQDCKNVHFLGRVAYDDLPACMAGIDVFINPYKADDIAASCSPLKVFEYLAAGKPVVSVPMPEVRRFAPDLRLAKSCIEFVDEIEQLLQQTPDEKVELAQRLKSLVAHDSWEERFERTGRLITEAFG